MYPEKPTGNNIIPEDIIFASNNTNKIVMSDQELLNGYSNDGESETALTSRPDANRFNNFWYQMQNTLVWVIKYIEELQADKISKTGSTMSGFLNMGNNKVISSATPTQNNDLTNKQYVDNRANGAMWISEVKMLAYPAIPQLTAGIEVVPCDGRAISRTDYAELFSLIGTAFGPGNGTTTFNIPDYRGLFLRGWSGGSGRDSARIYGTIQECGSPNITGQFAQEPGKNPRFGGAFYKGGSVSNNSANPGGESDNLFIFDASRVSGVYQNGLTETRPVNSTCYYVIRIK